MLSRFKRKKTTIILMSPDKESALMEVARLKKIWEGHEKIRLWKSDGDKP